MLLLSRKLQYAAEQYTSSFSDYACTWDGNAATFLATCSVYATEKVKVTEEVDIAVLESFNFLLRY
jgi:hypothetical protein